MNLKLTKIKKKDLHFTLHKLGEGAQGVVYRGKWAGSTVAIKSMKIGTKAKYLIREMKVHETLHHPNIIQIMGLCIDVKWHIVMEYFDSTSLKDIIHNEFVREDFDLKDIEKKNKIAFQICTAITFLHEQEIPIVHRDIKPDNILVNGDYFVKLCDLGLSLKEDMGTMLRTTCANNYKGSPIFSPPETLLHKKPATVASDVWSLACSLVELYKEDHVWDLNPYDPMNNLLRYLRMKKKPEVDKVPFNLQVIFYNCFEHDPLNRPKALTLLKAYEKIVS